MYTTDSYIAMCYMIKALEKTGLVRRQSSLLLAYQPEWYFLFAYAILRSIPNKLGGVIALVISIVILFIIPIVHIRKFQGLQFYPINQIIFWFYVTILCLLTWAGAMPVEDPYVIIRQILTVIYFSYYFINPIVAKIWDNILN